MRTKNEKMYSNIMEEMRKDERVTERFIANKYGYSERTIRRYVRILKKEGKIDYQKEKGFRWWSVK